MGWRPLYWLHGTYHRSQVSLKATNLEGIWTLIPAYFCIVIIQFYPFYSLGTSSKASLPQRPMKRKQRTSDPLLEFTKTCQAFTNKFTAPSTPKTSFQKYGEYVGLCLSEMPEKEALACISKIDELFLKKSDINVNSLQMPSAKALSKSVQALWSEQSSSQNVSIYQLMD